MWEQTRIACTQISEACLGCRAEEEEEVNHSKYLGSHREEESLDEETRGHQIREAEREIQVAVPRNSPDSEEDDKGRQADLHGRPGKLSRMG